LIDRYSDPSDNDSGSMDDIEYESYEDGSEDVFLPDPVDSDLWIEQCDADQRRKTFPLSSIRRLTPVVLTFEEDSEVNVIIHYDSEDESTVSSNTLHEDTTVL
jgi:hypothetical protein